MSFPRYPAYKDSGVEWLGEVPEHWEITRLGFESWVRARLGWKGLKAEEYVDAGYAFLSTPNIKGREIDFKDVNYINKARYDESPEIRLTCGDVLLAKDGSTLGICNVLRSLPCPATVNSSIAVITPSERLNSIYLHYLLCGNGMQQLIQQKKGGMGVPHLFQADLVKFAIPLPTPSEQASIATFLDRETAKIDALIAEQQRLIELLQEKRQAVISHAVTKGLNPDAPMKDSGVEWLGEVPEHWSVSAVGHRYEVRLGKMLDEKRVTGEHLGVYLRNTDVQWESINVDELPEMDFDPSERDRYSLLEGDLLVCEGGEVGRSAIWQSQLALCFYQKALHRLRPYNQRSDNSHFQLYVMRMACSLGVFEASSGKATINHLPAESFRRYRFAYPPFDEQIAIAKHLSQACTRMNELETEAHSLVSRLQERRSALISAAVTGQIDVRGLVPDAEAA